MTEDSAWGSGAVAAGAYLLSYGETNITMVLRQGRIVGRDATLNLITENDKNELNIYVGGHSNSCIEGFYDV